MKLLSSNTFWQDMAAGVGIGVCAALLVLVGIYVCLAFHQ